MAEQVIIYGAIGCQDTVRTKNRLRQMGVAYHFVNVDYNMAVERFVLFINRGLTITPIVIIDRGKYKTVLVRPTNDELDKALGSTEYVGVK